MQADLLWLAQGDRLLVRCSCGKSNMAIFNKWLQVFVCPGWEFRKSKDVDGHLLPGWHCGEAGHYQMPVKSYHRSL